MEEPDGFVEHGEHDAHRGENGHGGAGDQQAQQQALYLVAGAHAAADAPPDHKQSQNGNGHHQHRQGGAADVLQGPVVIGGSLHLGADLAGDDIAADQVADIVDHQIDPVRRQRADLRGKSGYHHTGDDIAFESLPAAEND